MPAMNALIFQHCW